MNDTKNVSVGKPKVGGAVFRAPLGTTLPTDSTTALNDAFVGLGFVSDEGVTNANSIESEFVKAWGGKTVYIAADDREDTFAMTFIEAMNTEVLKAYYGNGNVSGSLTDGITVKVNDKMQESHCWVIDTILQGNRARRIVIPNGVVSETGDVVYVDNEVIGYPVTITAMPDSDGNTHYEYTQGTESGGNGG